jgi:hypothetical protein
MVCVSNAIAVCTVKNSWWWTEELSETCRVLFQKQICEISASSWFYYKKSTSQLLCESLLASCQRTGITYTIAVCTAKNSWWWTEELSETCRILSQKYICEISTSSWFYYMNLHYVRSTEHQIVEAGMQFRYFQFMMWYFRICYFFLFLITERL